jgi:hypothetical protein
MMLIYIDQCLKHSEFQVEIHVEITPVDFLVVAFQLKSQLFCGWVCCKSNAGASACKEDARRGIGDVCSRRRRAGVRGIQAESNRPMIVAIMCDFHSLTGCL